MATYTGTAADETWTLVKAGTFSLDGLGGVDTLKMGTSLRSSFNITLGSDGGVHIDSLSGASQPAHITLYNMEKLVFNSGRDTLDLTTYFGDHVAPTAAITDDTAGVARGNVTYSVAFNESVTGLTASDFSVSHGSVLSVSGSGNSYHVVVAPAAGLEGTMSLSLLGAAVTDAAGNPNGLTSSAAQPIDTLAPTVVAFNPGDGASAVSPSSNLAVTFSESVQRGSGNIVLQDAHGGLVASYDAATSANLTISGNTLVIDPSIDLAFGSSYKLVFAAGSLTDVVGNGFSGSTAWGFSTGANSGVAQVMGTAGNDRLPAGAGTEHVDGAGGIDTAVFPLAREAYHVSLGTDGSVVVAAVDGSSTSTLAHVERLEFGNLSLAMDLGGHAGDVVRALGAVFGAAAVDNPQYVGIGLSLLDGGMSLEAAMQLALDTRLGPNATHAQVVDLLYTNVVGSPPPAKDLADFVALLDNHSYTPGSLAVLAAETSLNDHNIDLVGLAATGVDFS